MDSTSINLLRRLQEPRAESAWQRFVDLYGPLIFYWGRRKGPGPEDAADLLQDVLATLVVKLPEFQYDRSQRFRGWLQTITVNRVTDLFRRRALRSVQPDVGFMHQIAAPDDSDLFLEVPYRSVIVRRALEMLRGEFNEATWQAYWLQVVDGLTAPVVADRLRITLNSTYLAKSSVLMRLREELQGLMD
jgi:RNA polymerase sigma-70 factor (ECF subfamily)